MKRLRILLHQFPLLIALRMFIVEWVTNIFVPGQHSSYSFFGEDRIIDFYLDHSSPKSIYYVDIGCNNPIRNSNTLRLYQRGARGLAVDANPAVVKMYDKIRIRDTCVCACVSDRTGYGELTITKWDVKSTVSEMFIKEYLTEDEVKDRIPVKYVTAQHLFESHGVPNDFDLLTVDFEGHDLEVLRSFNLDTFRPTLIVIEMHDVRKDLAGSLKDSGVYNYLVKQSYKLCAFTTLNGYFVRQK